MPPRVARNPLIAVRAHPVLPPPQPTQLPTPFERLLHLAGEPLGEIRVERRIVGIRRRVDFGVRPFPELTQSRQQLVLLSEAPIASLVAPEVALLDPPCPLLRVSATSPSPQRLPDLMVASRERA